MCVFLQRPTFLLTLCSWGRCRLPCGASCPPRPASPYPHLPSERAGCSGHWGSGWSLHSAATPRSLAPPLSGHLKQGRRSTFRISLTDLTWEIQDLLIEKEEWCVWMFKYAQVSHTGWTVCILPLRVVHSTLCYRVHRDCLEVRQADLPCLGQREGLDRG